MYVQRTYTVVVTELRFAWDPRKAASNRAKHGVTFDEARTAFYDPSALVISDPEHSEQEDRFVLLGLSGVRDAQGIRLQPRAEEPLRDSPQEGGHHSPR